MSDGKNDIFHSCLIRIGIVIITACILTALISFIVSTSIATQKTVLFVAVSSIYALFAAIVMSMVYVTEHTNTKLLVGLVTWIVVGLLFAIGYLPSPFILFYVLFWLIVTAWLVGVWQHKRKVEKQGFKLLYYRLLLGYLIVLFTLFILSLIPTYTTNSLFKIFDGINIFLLFIFFLVLVTSNSIPVIRNIKKEPNITRRYEAIWKEQQVTKKGIEEQLSANIKQPFQVIGALIGDSLERLSNYLDRFGVHFRKDVKATLGWFIEDFSKICCLLVLIAIVPFFVYLNNEYFLAHLQSYLQDSSWAKATNSFPILGTNESLKLLIEVVKSAIVLLFFVTISIAFFCFNAFVSSKMYSIPSQTMDEIKVRLSEVSIWLCGGMFLATLFLAFISNVFYIAIIHWNRLGFISVFSLLAVAIWTLKKDTLKSVISSKSKNILPFKDIKDETERESKEQELHVEKKKHTFQIDENIFILELNRELQAVMIRLFNIREIALQVNINPQEKKILNEVAEREYDFRTQSINLCFKLTDLHHRLTQIKINQSRIRLNKESISLQQEQQIDLNKEYDSFEEELMYYKSKINTLRIVSKKFYTYSDLEERISQIRNKKLQNETRYLYNDLCEFEAEFYKMFTLRDSGFTLFLSSFDSLRQNVNVSFNEIAYVEEYDKLKQEIKKEAYYIQQRQNHYFKAEIDPQNNTDATEAKDYANRQKSFGKIEMPN